MAIKPGDHLDQSDAAQVTKVALRRLNQRNVLAEASVTIAAFIASAIYALMTPPSDKKLDYIILLDIATIVLFAGLVVSRRYFFERGRVFFAIADRAAGGQSGQDDHLKLCRQICDLRGRAVVGALFGLAIAAAPFVLPGDYGSRNDQLYFALFLFFANALTGSAHFSLAQFFIHSRDLFSRLVVNMWGPENESVQIFLGVANRLALTTILYVSLSMTSILFSSFLIGPVMVAYIAFSVFSIIFVIVVPHLTVIGRLTDQKKRLLRTVAQSLETNTQALLKGEGGDLVMLNTRNLIELRRWVGEVSYFPLRLRSLGAFASGVLLSLVPAIVDWFLRRA